MPRRDLRLRLCITLSAVRIVGHDAQLGAPLDPDRYFDEVLYTAEPGGAPIELGQAAEWQAWWRVQTRRIDVNLARLARRQGFALTTSQLRDAGYTRERARRRCAAPRPRSRIPATSS